MPMPDEAERTELMDQGLCWCEKHGVQPALIVCKHLINGIGLEYHQSSISPKHPHGIPDCACSQCAWNADKEDLVIDL
jgi:hypothetical protein